MSKLKLSRTINKIRTPITLLNSTLRGGLPLGGLFQFWGASKSGKSTCALQTAQYFLEDYPDGRVVIIDSEGNYPESSRLEKVFNLHPHNSVLETIEEDSRVFFFRMSVIEKAFSTITKFAKESREGIPTLVILDSISSLSASALVDEVNKSSLKDTAVNVYAGGQSVNSAVITKLLGPLMDDVINSWCSVIFINQITVDRDSYIKAEKPKGGYALAHSLHLSVKFQILNSSLKSNSDTEISKISNKFSENPTLDETIKPHTLSMVLIDKNKYGITDSGASVVMIDNLSGGHINPEYEVFQCLAKAKHLIHSSGRWTYFSDEIKQKHPDLKLSYTDNSTGEIKQKSVNDSWDSSELASSKEAFKLLKKELSQYYLKIKSVEYTHAHMIDIAKAKGIDITKYLEEY